MEAAITFRVVIAPSVTDPVTGISLALLRRGVLFHTPSAIPYCTEGVARKHPVQYQI